MFHRRLDEVAHAGEIDDALELRADLTPTHPENRSAQIDVLAAAQLRVKSGPDFDQRGQPPRNRDFTRRLRRDVRQQLENCALAGPVVTDDPDRFTAGDLERD